MTTGAAILTHVSCCGARTGESIPLWQGAALAVAFCVRLVASVRAFGAAWLDGIREDDLGLGREGPHEHDSARPTTAGAEHREATTAGSDRSMLGSLGPGSRDSGPSRTGG